MVVSRLENLDAFEEEEKLNRLIAYVRGLREELALLTRGTIGSPSDDTQFGNSDNVSLDEMQNIWMSSFAELENEVVSLKKRVKTLEDDMN